MVRPFGLDGLAVAEQRVHSHTSHMEKPKQKMWIRGIAYLHLKKGAKTTTKKQQSRHITWLDPWS